MPGTSTVTDLFALRIPKPLLARLRKLAKAEGCSVGALIIAALEETYPAEASERRAPPPEELARSCQRKTALMPLRLRHERQPNLASRRTIIAGYDLRQPAKP